MIQRSKMALISLRQKYIRTKKVVRRRRKDLDLPKNGWQQPVYDHICSNTNREKERMRITVRSDGKNL